jgi:anti-sigma regulatory factor (Ser/Thr protein kinase)
MKARLTADASAPSEARAFVTAQLSTTRLPPDVAAEDVVLVTSELVTNAVNAGGTTLEVEILASPHRVELVVSDDAAGWPAPNSPDPTDLSGRGLQIVNHLAHSWDTTRRSRGKAVAARWFDRRRHPASQ